MKHSLTLTVCLAAGMTALPALSLAATQAVDRGQEPMSLLKDLHAVAADAAQHASDLKSSTRAVNPSWQTEGVRLTELKVDINKMASILMQLEQVRDSAPALDQKAIDQAVPLMKSLARNTNEAMAYLNAKQSDLWVPSYVAYVNNLERDSVQLYKTVGEYIKFARVRNQEQHLGQNLGVEAGR